MKGKSIGEVNKGLWWGVDHWIVLASSIQVRESNGKPWMDITAQPLQGKDIDNYQISFNTYTWGNHKNIGTNNANSTITISDVGDLVSYFYGYISSTPGR
jgi:hypothetical protein